MKRLFAIVLSMLLMAGTVLSVGAETETQPELTYDEAAILDAMAESWVWTCTENIKYCSLALVKYGIGRPVEACEEALRKDFLENIKNGYKGAYGVEFEFSIEALESYYGDGAIQTDLTTYLSTSADAPLLSAERIAHDTAKSNLDELLKNGDFFGNVKLSDVIKENYGFILGEASCIEALASFASALKEDDLDAKRQLMLEGAYLATFGCEMSIADADKLARPHGLTEEEILMEIVDAGIDLAGDIAPQISYTYDAIKISTDLLIKTLSMQAKLNTLSGFMNAPEAIDQDMSRYYDALSNQYGAFTFKIDNYEVSLGEYNGYLLNKEEFAIVDIPEKMYDAFTVVEFGYNRDRAFVEDKDITEITIPSAIRTRNFYVVQNCDKLQKVNYNAINCVADVGYGFFADCDSDFEVNFGPGVTTIPKMFIRGCGIKKIEFPDTVTTMYPGALYECPELTTVTIPESVTEFIIHFDEYPVVGSCEKLQQVHYNAENAQRSWDSYIFDDCGNATSDMTIKIGDDVKVLPGSFIRNCGIKALNIPEGVKKIGASCAINCMSLETITVPTTVTDFEMVATSSNYVFSGNNALKTVNYNATKAVGQHLAYIFKNCESNFAINIGSGVEEIPQYFMYNCGITEIAFSASVKTINWYCVVNCDALTTVTVPSSVENAGLSFIYGCDNLETVYFNANATNLSESGSLGSALICSNGSYTDPKMQVILGDMVTEVPGYFIENCAITEFIYPEGITKIRQKTIIDCKALEYVYIPSTLQEVGSGDFCDIIKGCDNLKRVDYCAPDVVRIGNQEYLFDNCGQNDGLELYIREGVKKLPKQMMVNSAVKSVSYPNTLLEIGPNQFKNCTKLTSITIPESVTKLHNAAFSECMYLTEIRFNAVNLETPPYSNLIFSSCGQNGDGIRVIIGAGVTQIPDYLFSPSGQNHTEAKIVSVEFEEGSVCRSIGRQAFDNCKHLVSVTIPDGVENIGQSAFYNCCALKQVYMPNSVQTLGACAFKNCTALTAAHMPEGLPSVVTELFYGCTSLASVNIPVTAEIIESSAFYGCAALAAVTIPGNVTLIDNSAFENSGLKKIVIPEGVETIDYRAFSGCTALSALTIPGTVTKIEQHAFSGCTALTEIRFNAVKMKDRMSDNSIFTDAGINTSGIKLIIGAQVQQIPAYLFYAGYDASVRPNIKSVEFEKGSVCTTIGQSAFRGLAGLTEVQLPKSLETIENQAFYNCTNMTQLRFAAVNLQVPLWKNNAFYGCGSEGAGIRLIIEAGVTQIPAGMFSATDYPENVAKIVSLEFAKDSACTFVGEGAFTDLTTLTTAKLAPSVTVIKPTTFKGCTALTDVELSPRTTMISTSAFEGCTGLTAISLPEKVSHIEKDAFKGCTSLVVVEFPKTMTSVGGGAFADCVNLTEIRFTGPAPRIWTAFTGVTATAYYPALEASWTEEMLQNYGGSITWVSYGGIEKFEIDVARMILGNSLQFQFGVEKYKIPDTTGLYAVIEKSWADGTTTQITVPATQWQDASPYWAISYDGLAAKEMADSFNVVIYNADGDAISNAKVDSVRAYVMRNIDKQNTVGKTIMVDMLNYGAAAQKNFKYNTGDLANNQLTASQKAWGTATAVTATDKRVQGANYMGTRLILESSIQMQVAFNGMTRDMYAIYSYTDNKGKVQNVRVEGAAFVDAGGILAIEMSKLVYADARAVVSITVYNADGSVYGTAKDSMESYAARHMKGNEVLSYLMKFTDSAKIYLYG